MAELRSVPVTATWQLDANCIDSDPEWWFVPDSEEHGAANYLSQ